MMANRELLLTLLVNAAWQIPVITVLAAGTAHLLRKGPGKYRHAVWVVALIAAILVPVCSATRNVATASISGNLPSISEAVPDAATSSDNSHTKPAPHPQAERSVSISPTAGFAAITAYLALLLLAALRLAVAIVNTEVLRRTTRSQSTSTPLAAAWRSCTAAYGLTNVQLLASSRCASPVALGVFKPAVVIPDSLWQEPSEELLTAAIGHELAHIARKDFIANLIYELLFVPIAFHPVTWLIRRNIKRTREVACDELVTNRLLKPQVYARSIVQIAATISLPAKTGFALGISEGGDLEDRIRRLLKNTSFDIRRARLIAAGAITTLVIATAAVTGLALNARGETATEGEIKQGIAAYNAGDFHTATVRFTTAVAKDPANLAAKLYLANSLMSEYYKDQNGPDERFVAAAMKQYTDVIARDANNAQALAGMTSLTMQSRNISGAHDWATKLTAVTPSDKTAWYTRGVLDWMAAFPEYQRARTAAGGAADKYEIPNANLRASFRNRYETQVNEGVEMLRKALGLDPGYDAAMAYMNLLYRLKAAMADNPQQSATLIAEADNWVANAIQAKKRNTSSPETTSAKLDPNGPPPGPAVSRITMVKAPAPPPPPPPPPPDKAAEQPASAAPKPAADQLKLSAGAEFWQVVGSSEMPATALLRQLSAKGFEAVLHQGSDHKIRVLAGPYFDPTAVTEARSRLEAAGYRVIGNWR